MAVRSDPFECGVTEGNVESGVHSLTHKQLEHLDSETYSFAARYVVHELVESKVGMNC